MKNLFLTLLLIIFYITIISAQSQIIFTQDKTESFLIEHTAGQSPITDAIIAKLAQGNNMSASALDITFTLSQKLRISRRDKIQTLTAELSNFDFDGRKNYKSFSAENYLLPGLINFKLKWYRGNQELAIHTFTNVSIEGNPVEIARVTEVDSIGGNNYKIVLSNIVFSYTQANKIEFEKFTSQVDEYYKKSNETKLQMQQIEGIDANEQYLKRLDNLNILYDYRTKVQKALDFAESVKNADFYISLPIDRNDPESLKANLDRLSLHANNVYTACDNIIRNLDAVYYERGMDMLAARQPERADYFFNQAIEVNPTFAPAHFQLARLYYNGGMVDRAVQKLFEVRGMTPDYQTKAQADELMQGIYNEMLLDATGLNNQGRYDDALAVLDRAREICQKWKEVLCRNTMDDETARALNGKYDNILRDCDTKISQNKLKEAEDLIQAALNFKAANQPFIPSDKRMSDRINNLYFKYLDLGDADLNAKKFQTAIGFYEQAERVCTTYREIECTDDFKDGLFKARTGIYYQTIDNAEAAYLAKDYTKAERTLNEAIAYRQKFTLNKDSSEETLFLKIKQAVYDDYIAKGKSLNTVKNFADALSNFSLAKKIEDNYSVRKNPALGGYINSAAQDYCLQLTAEGLRYVDVNNLPQARSKYSQAKSISTDYGLTGNKTIEREFAKLKDRIFAQECINAQNEYDRLYREALAKINVKAFPEAERLLIDAQNHVVANADCEISSKSAADKQTEIAQAANYMNQIINVDSQLNNRNYRPTIELYLAAAEYFAKNNVARFGLKCDDLYTFIISKSADFINYGASYYIELKDYDKSLSLLKILATKGYNKNYTKTNQTQLAAAYASRDYGQNPGSAYKTNIISYVGEDKYFKQFSKSYKKQWKKLD